MKPILILVLCVICGSLQAAIPPGHWQCFAFDSKEKSYEGIGKSQKTAMQSALIECKRRAREKHCKTAQSYCEQGPLSLEDRCFVSDTAGRSWSATGPDACKTAMSLCVEWQFLHGKTTQCSVKHF